jgi:hypothetical protein
VEIYDEVLRRMERPGAPAAKPAAEADKPT